MLICKNGSPDSPKLSGIDNTDWIMVSKCFPSDTNLKLNYAGQILQFEWTKINSNTLVSCDQGILHNAEDESVTKAHHLVFTNRFQSLPQVMDTTLASTLLFVFTDVHSCSLDNYCE